MIKINKLGYYNYFLMLSLALIAGYFITSLFFLNRTSKSGKQAEEYGMSVDEINAIIQHTSQLESTAYSYMITHSEESEARYKHKKERLLNYVALLGLHCTTYHIARDETNHLNHLVSQRLEMLDMMMEKDSMSIENKKKKISFGNNTTLDILSTLKAIRLVNNDLRERNQKDAEIANRNAMILLTIFGAVMLLIVFTSFFKMRKEILRNERYLKEINQINIELSSFNEHLENFAYIASHDLSEPLRKIETFGDLIEIELSNESFDHKAIISHVNRMQSASSRMQELIEDLLSYSRISRQFEIRDEINLKETVNTVLSDLEVSIKENKADIEIHDLPTEIRADKIQMRQLFQNLISNAIKFKKENVAPKVEIKSEVINVDQIHLEDFVNGEFTNYWKISVSDNGIGFDEKYRDKIFAVFQRLHGRSAYEGTGIGLSVCKKITENHKGTITAISSEGEGATFIIYLPIK